MTTGGTFEIGEPINAVAAGTLTEAPVASNTQWILADAGGATEAGIAAWGPGAGNINPETGIAYVAGDNIPYWPINEGNLFITKNVFAAGGATLAAPILTDMYENYQLVYGAANDKWGVEKTEALSGIDYMATIVGILDAQKTPIARSGNAGVYIVFLLTGTLAAA
jgi:hypothetical protein